MRSLLGNSILTLGKSSAKQCDAVQFLRYISLEIGTLQFKQRDFTSGSLFPGPGSSLLDWSNQYNGMATLFPKRDSSAGLLLFLSLSYF